MGSRWAVKVSLSSSIYRLAYLLTWLSRLKTSLQSSWKADYPMLLNLCDEKVRVTLVHNVVHENSVDLVSAWNPWTWSVDTFSLVTLGLRPRTNKLHGRQLTWTQPPCSSSSRLSCLPRKYNTSDCGLFVKVFFFWHKHMPNPVFLNRPVLVMTEADP